MFAVSGMVLMQSAVCTLATRGQCWDTTGFQTGEPHSITEREGTGASRCGHHHLMVSELADMKQACQEYHSSALGHSRSANVLLCQVVLLGYDDREHACVL